MDTAEHFEGLLPKPTIMSKKVDINPVSQRPRMERRKSGWHAYDEAKAAKAAKQKKKELQNQHRQLIVLATRIEIT